MRDLRRLLFYLKPHWGKFALATVAMLFVGLLQSAIGALIVPIFDQALRESGDAGQRTPTLFRSARHQVCREVFGDALGDGEGDEQDGDGAPRLEARVGDDVLEAEEGGRALRVVAALAQRLVEDGDDERADGALQEPDEEHGDGREGELPPVRLEVE